MGQFGTIDRLVASTGAKTLYNNITLGEVVNSDDPQQMGRLQVYVPALDNDRKQALPWALYSSAFGGISESDTRGPNQTASSGPVAYGLWAVPKVGATVLIMCIDNNPLIRVWLGCINGLQFPHTMPHGRYVDGDGPLTSTEQPIEPLHSTHSEAFGGSTQTTARDSFEYNTRGADRPLSGNSAQAVGTYADYSKKPEDMETQGYGTNQNENGGEKHSNIYSMTTPGFHAWSMDDNPESCRVRIRTTTGNQIIFDDTNERIYISTAKGKTWIELDESGTLDIFSEQDLSLRSQQDINIVSDKTVRIAGNEGVHITSKGDVRMYSGKDTQIKADGDIRTTANNVFTTASTDIHLNTDGNIRVKGSTLFLESAGLTSVKASTVEMGSVLNVGGPVGVTGTLNVVGIISSGIDVTSPLHSLNLHQHTYITPLHPAPPPAQPGTTLPSPAVTGTIGFAVAAPVASESEPAETTTAFFPSRVPRHEPYARTYLKLDVTDTDELSLDIFDSIINDPDSISEYAYNDDGVGNGSAERGKSFSRNAKWQR